jgi:hypothetical protein
MSGYRYILRYYIDPEFHEEERIAELLEFCRAGRVDEVMLFFNAEELNTGHVTLEELQPWLQMALKLKQQLAAQGVGMSVNPWTTTVHSPRGRVLKPGQNFTLMVGETGQDNGVTACPLCPEWQRYLIELWTEVARIVRPSAIWIEDDWRYHNHGTALGYGGCYCKLHLEKFGKVVGRAVSREDILNTVFGGGKPHPWRKIWFDLNGRSIAEPMEQLRRSIQAVAPETRLALMCGGVDAAGAEGRDWHRLQDAVGIQPAFMIRPTMSPYTETWTMRKYPVQARLVTASLKRPLENYPELESGPRHGPYSKGCGYAGWELLGTACFGAHGITMNHYDMMGCGTAVDTRFAATLAKVKPQLNALRALGIDDDDSLGANILFHPASAQHMRSQKPGTMKGMNNHSGEWGNIASILGFSYRFTDQVKSSGQPYLVNNQTLAAFSDEEIRELLKNTVMLDATAATGLLERGFGAELGISAAREHRHNVSGYAYEEIQETDPSVYGLSLPRLTVQRAARKMYEFTVDGTAEIPSWIYRFDQKKMFPGTMVFRNARGGTIITLAYPLGDFDGDEWFYMGYFNSFRRIFMQRLIWGNAPKMQGVFAEELPFQCYHARTADGGYFAAALNSSSDPAESLTLRLVNPGGRKFEILSTDGHWNPLDAEIIEKPGNHLKVIIRQEVPVHQGIFLKF